MAIIFFAIAAVLAGAVLPFQPGINNVLRDHLASPLLAALVSFSVGTAAIAIIVLIVRPANPQRSLIAQAPWWAWIGGLVGAMFVTLSIILAPRLGASAFVAAVVCGQMLSSIVIDRFGLVGFPVREITPTRLLGIAALILGVILIQFGGRPLAEPPDPTEPAPAAQDQPPDPSSG